MRIRLYDIYIIPFTLSQSCLLAVCLPIPSKGRYILLSSSSLIPIKPRVSLRDDPHHLNLEYLLNGEGSEVVCELQV